VRFKFNKFSSFVLLSYAAEVSYIHMLITSHNPEPTFLFEVTYCFKFVPQLVGDASWYMGLC
jgi:hypothetical protein